MSLIPLNKELVEPFSTALQDFEITDFVFSKNFRDEPAPDTNIVIVNIGTIDNAELGLLLNKINKYKPAAVGVNKILREDPPTEDGLYFNNLLLQSVLFDTKNLVMVSKLQNYDAVKKEYTSVITSDSLFTHLQNEDGIRYAELAYNNLPNTDKDFKTTRYIHRTEKLNGVEQISFAEAIINNVAPEKVKKFKSRENEIEIINYKGNFDKFYIIDAEDALNENFDPSLIANKIVIMGYTGESFFSEKFWDSDKFYTPMNKEYAGKTRTDMYETVLLANIVSMILNEDYIEILDDRLNIIINLIISFHNVILFSLLFHAAAVWWDIFSIVLTLVEIILLQFVSIIVYGTYQTDVNLNFSIIFVLVVSTFVELYYGLFKIAMQQFDITSKIFKEETKRKKLEDIIGTNSKDILKPGKFKGLDT
ncbi:MAG: CHASE2 domain-containing protein [Cytophagales bacterium]|nr:CHASE2 domain-containing protein [Cytophagales bacterium]